MISPESFSSDLVIHESVADNGVHMLGIGIFDDTHSAQLEAYKHEEFDPYLGLNWETHLTADEGFALVRDSIARIGFPAVRGALELIWADYDPFELGWEDGKLSGKKHELDALKALDDEGVLAIRLDTFHNSVLVWKQMLGYRGRKEIGLTTTHEFDAKWIGDLYKLTVTPATREVVDPHFVAIKDAFTEFRAAPVGEPILTTGFTQTTA